MIDHRAATEDAQAVLRGEAEPRPEIVFVTGVPLDFETGVVRCPDCGVDSIQLVEALSYPAGGSPTNAGIFLRCRICSCSFCISVDAEGGQAILRTNRLR